MQNPDLLAASCRVALAAYLHDLGKFAERARIDVNKEALDAHKTQYCPFHTFEPNGKNGYHTHVHAAYTGLAFDIVEQTTPDLIKGDMHPFINRAQLQADHTQATDSLINAAAAHHRPDTFLQWIIATADRVASGFERDEFEKYNAAKDEGNNTKTGKNHYQARQLSLFEQIRLDGKQQKFAAKDLQWRYPLQALSPSAIFPQLREACEPGDDAPAQAQYNALWQDFLTALQSIPASHRNNWSLWLDHFDTAWLTFTHAIPAATAFGTKPEVSLYDHSKTTAALATALWRWHEAQGQTDASAAAALKDRSDWHSDKLLLIQGDFFGIQDFIFAEGSQTNKAAAKLLRGRSFQVSLFTELAALKVLDALSLPPTSQITNAAGKFLIVAPNTAEVRAQLAQVRAGINQWFLKHSFGLAGLGLIGKPASCNDLLKGHFKTLMQDLFAALEKAKLQRFDLTGAGNAVFDVAYPHGVCQYNDKLPADQSEGHNKASAALSRDQITLGSALTREDRLLVVRDPAALSGGNLTRLEVPVFGYGVAFTKNEEVTGKFGALAKDGNLQRCWDFSLPDNLTDTLWNGYARRFINAYVPHFSELDLQTSSKYLGLEGEVDWDDLRFGIGKTLNHIACDDRTCPKEPDKWQGQVALMTLKGDVDNLGTIFQQGLGETTFAKMAALSRQMNAFFAIWLPAICSEEFPNTYTVFAGGDDFFLIGPWHSTQTLAARMAAEFKTYVAHNDNITFSAGMVMTKPGHPINALASQAEEALSAAKGTDKNALVLYGERVRWGDWGKVQAVQVQLERVRNSYDLSTGYVYGLMQLIDLASDKTNPEHAMWRSRFAYRTRRYVVDKLPHDVRSIAQNDLANQLGEQGIEQLGSQFRIPLFNHFYRQR
ncbi:MAG: type III-A CRISPR-associated protein Cas10/Csm1 [Burkholderiales bacterium RIFOXYD12_FULL_59_19]|nr:MAG: type III-A CRISPR-associated protein Cas10/Csm1 [Burkholderiales bacterium RIFOXYD12_FULL_59_19]